MLSPRLLSSLGVMPSGPGAELILSSFILFLIISAVIVIRSMSPAFSFSTTGMLLRSSFLNTLTKKSLRMSAIFLSSASNCPSSFLRGPIVVLAFVFDFYVFCDLSVDFVRFFK